MQTGTSTRDAQGRLAFDQEEVQQIWEQKPIASQIGIGPDPHNQLEVRIISGNNGTPDLELVSLYRGNDGYYEDDQELLELLAACLDLRYTAEKDDDEFPSMMADEEGFYSGVCTCGGTVLPMYDEHPNWLVFCRSCDQRWESSASPVCV